MKRCALTFSISLLLAAASVGCSADSAPQPGEELPNSLNGDPFVPFYKSAELVPEQTALAGRLATSESSFYLAINKAELGKKWFLSAYLKQFFPEDVYRGAGMSMGTRVVSFKIQNGKLFVFDVDDNKKTSDTFDPSVLVEAYPIVTNAAFTSLPGASNYVLFDPSAGLNRFNAVSDFLGAGRAGLVSHSLYPQSPIPFAIELMYSQRFRAIADGVTFEQVFTGYTDGDKLPAFTPTSNPLRGHGTLGIALRRYAEGPGFKNRPYPKTPFYLTSNPRIVPNEGRVEHKPIRWNIYKGMKPIRWTISHLAQLAQDEPKNASFDLIGAIKHGIEDWNNVFGFKVFEAVVGKPEDSFADDDKNFVIWDNRVSGLHFANTRTNPNTGEVRGASIYFDRFWLYLSNDRGWDDPPASSAPAKFSFAAETPVPVSLKPALVWSANSDDTTYGPLVNFVTRPVNAAERMSPPKTFMSSSITQITVPLTKQQKFFNLMRNMVLYQVGHTLGLSDNYKGTLVPYTSSVMDPMTPEYASRFQGIGDYDRDALKYLYHLSDKLPTQPFCTGGQETADPECSSWDITADPLQEYYIPNYQWDVQTFLSAGAVPPTAEVDPFWLASVLGFARSGKDTNVRQAAWLAAIKGAKVGVPGATLPAGYTPERIDFMANQVFRATLFNEFSPSRPHYGFRNTEPVTDPNVLALLISEARGNLLNLDNIRSWRTRRTIVDVLKKLQLPAALGVLTEAAADLQAKLPTLSGAEANEATDLLSRIQVAMSPYYQK